MSVIGRIVFAARRLRPAPDRVICRMRGGYKLELHPASDRHERHLFDARTYEPSTLALFDKVLRPGDTMVDVGANLGLMTLHAARCVGEAGIVVAVEPHPSHYRRLMRNIALNGLASVRPVQIAAGAEPEQRLIYDVPAVSIGRSSLILPDVESYPGAVVSVERLDTILAAMQVGPVRLLKIDVEGFEPEVIRGAPDTLAQLPVICMEVTSAITPGTYAPLAAHDMIMSGGGYSSYRFLRSKGRESPLVEVNDRSLLTHQVDDNVIYIPHGLRRNLPVDLFSN